VNVGTKMIVNFVNGALSEHFNEFIAKYWSKI